MIISAATTFGAAKLKLRFWRMLIRFRVRWWLACRRGCAARLFQAHVVLHVRIVADEIPPASYQWINVKAVIAPTSKSRARSYSRDSCRKIPRPGKMSTFRLAEWMTA